MSSIGPLEDDVTFAHIERAARRIAKHVHRTPVLESSSLTGLTHHTLVCFKCENLQKTGSFKIRGATNAVACEVERRAKETDSEEERRRPPLQFLTHSSGNHGQALAFAAKSHGYVAHVVVPDTAPGVKIRAMEHYGANVVFCRPTLADRMRTCDEVGQAHPGAVFVHPFDNPDVIAGQGTLGIEFMEQTNNELDAIIVPVGGGGLASGVAMAVKHLKPEIAVFAAEPEGADDTYRSFQQGARVLSHREGLPKSIADGLLTINSDRTFRMLKGTLHGVLRVSEDQIRHAMYLVYERCKLVIEPSAAVGVAAVLACPEALAPYKRVGIVICGGNVDISSISSLAKL
jgi:threonine dehydratase